MDKIDLLVRDGIVSEDFLELMAEIVRRVAAQKFGEVRLTIKGGRVTHLFAGQSWSVGGEGINPDPTLRNDRSRYN